MAIDYSKNKHSASNSTSAPKDQDQVYLNLGFYSTDSDGTRAFTRIGTFGIPLSALVPTTITKNMMKNADFHERTVTKNNMILAVNKIASGLEAGDAQEIGLSVEIRRRGEEVETVVTPEDEADVETLVNQLLAG